METIFKLDGVSVRTNEYQDFKENEYTLKFSSPDEEKTITLSGLGSIKEAVKI